MNKILFITIWVWFTFVLLFSSNVLAELNVERLKVYVNNERQISLEDITGNEDGGLIEKVKASDVIEYNLRLINTWNDTAKDIEIKGVIEDINNGDDLIVDLDDFNLEYNKEATKKITFNIPSDVRRDDYNSYISITATYDNYSDPDFQIDFDVEITSEGISSSVNTVNIISELSNTTKEYLNTTKEYLAKLDRLPEIEQLKASKAGLEEQVKTLTAERDKITDEKSTMLKINECDVKVKEAEEKNNWIYWGGIGFAVYWFGIRKKKTPEESRAEEQKSDLRMRRF